MRGASFNQLIGTQQERFRNCKPERLRRLQIDHQLKFDRLLDGKVCGLGALQDSVHVSGTTPEQIEQACPVRHEAACHHILSQLEHPRQPVVREEVDDPLDMELVNWIGSYHETIGTL